MLLICHNNQKDSIKKKCEGIFLEGDHGFREGHEREG